MGRSTVGDLCIHDGKLLGGSYYGNFVGVWVADISLIEPYDGGAVAGRDSPSKQKVVLQESPLERARSYKRTNSSMRSSSPDSDSNEIKTIYIDTAGRNRVTSRKPGIFSPKHAIPSESKEMSNLASRKQSSRLGLSAKTSGPGSKRSLDMPSTIPHDFPDGRESVHSGREHISSGRASTTMPLKPPHMRKPSNGNFDMEKLSTALEFKSVETVKTAATMRKALSFNNRLNADDNAKELSEDKLLDIMSVAEKVKKTSGAGSDKSLDVPSTVPRDIPDGRESVCSGREHIFPGRASTTMPLKPPHMQKPSNGNFNTEKLSTALESKSVETVKTAATMRKALSFENRLNADNNTKELSEDKHLDIKSVAAKVAKTSPLALLSDQENIVQGRTCSLVERLEKRGRLNSEENYGPQTTSHDATLELKASTLRAPDMTSVAVIQAPKTSLFHTSDTTTHAVMEAPKIRPFHACDTTARTIAQAPTLSPLQNSNQQIDEQQESGTNDSSVIANWMQDHDALLSTFKSCLANLQVVRHFWDRNDVKGAISAIRKLPDHSVQADVVSALVGRVEIMTLDLFSCLAAVLLGLLDSKVERHAVVSLEMLLKLVAVFGLVVHSAVSAPPAVRVDLHAEERRGECWQNLQWS